MEHWPFVISPMNRTFRLIKFLYFFSQHLRVEKINLILETKIFAYIFTVFCLAVLINGSNFIDGVNILSIGYYLLITLCLTFLTSQTELVINQNLIEATISKFDIKNNELNILVDQAYRPLTLSSFH